MWSLQGKRFGNLYLHFDDGTPIGLCNSVTGTCRFNPPSKAIVNPGVDPLTHIFMRAVCDGCMLLFRRDLHSSTLPLQIIGVRCDFDAFVHIQRRTIPIQLTT